MWAGWPLQRFFFVLLFFSWAIQGLMTIKTRLESGRFVELHCHCQQCNDTHTNDYLLFCPGTWHRSFSACNTFWMCSYFGLLLNRCRCRLTLCWPLYFFLETKSLPSIPTKRYESEPDLPKPKTASSKRRPVQPPLPFYREDVQPAKKGQVNNVLPSRRLIAPSLLTTENIARSKYSSRKKLLLHEKLPKPPKGASKLTSFRAILAVRRHAAVRDEGLLAPSSARFSVDKRCRLCMHGAIARALDRCSAIHC